MFSDSVLSKSCNQVQLFATSWAVARQAPLSMGFPRQECWSGMPFPPPGDLPNPGIEPESPVAPALAGRFLTTKPKESGEKKKGKKNHFAVPLKLTQNCKSTVLQ